MGKLNTPSYNHLIPREHQIRATQELYDNYNKINDVIPSTATGNNQLADKAWVTSTITSSISGIGGMAISKVFTQSSLVAANNTYYALRTNVSSAMTIQLPGVNDSTSEAVHFKVFLTLDTGGSVAYSGNRSSDTIYYTEGYSLVEGNTYEIDVCFNGKAWVIDAKKLTTV